MWHKKPPSPPSNDETIPLFCVWQLNFDAAPTSRNCVNALSISLRFDFELEKRGIQLWEMITMTTINSGFDIFRSSESCHSHFVALFLQKHKKNRTQATTSATVVCEHVTLLNTFDFSLDQPKIFGINPSEHEHAQAVNIFTDYYFFLYEFWLFLFTFSSFFIVMCVTWNGM